MDIHVRERLHVQVDDSKQLVASVRAETLDLAEKIAHASQLECEIHCLEDSRCQRDELYPYIVYWHRGEAMDVAVWANADCMGAPLQCTYTFLSGAAIAPYKKRPADAGITVSLVNVHKQMGDVIIFSTRLVVTPPFGVVLDVMCNSELIEQGFVLAQPMYIDQNNTEVLVPLRKLTTDASLTLPADVVKLVPRQWYNVTYSRC